MTQLVPNTDCTEDDGGRGVVYVGTLTRVCVRVCPCVPVCMRQEVGVTSKKVET